MNDQIMPQELLFRMRLLNGELHRRYQVLREALHASPFDEEAKVRFELACADMEAVLQVICPTLDIQLVTDED